MTAASIGAGQAAGYSAYLESRTVASGRGDYYLSADGEPVEAPGVWHVLGETGERLGLDGDEPVSADQLVALMEGRHPRDGSFIRATGADGRRAGGIDLTFSAPKSVSVVWALAGDEQRAGIEDAHGRAVARALEHLRAEVPVVRRGAGGRSPELARDVVAAEFRHTTARGVADGGLPDPQLHSHVVVTGVVRSGGEVAAVASRPVFRAARELGAFYRAALADELRDRGYGIEAGTGKGGRYFELAGVPEGVREALSGRTREVWLAAERFRARHGRAPERGALRNLKLENRRAKAPQTMADLERVWREVAAEHGLDRARAQGLWAVGERGPVHRDATEGWEVRSESALTAQRATFEARELRATVLEQTVGDGAPEQVGSRAAALREAGRVLELEGGRMTTGRIREMERAVETRAAELSAATGPDVSERAREQAVDEVGERLGAALSVEQRDAVRLLGGPGRFAILVGEAGAGKGVVIDAAARAEQLAGREPVGVAVAGATAERLGEDCPSLAGRTMTLDALLARERAGAIGLGERSTVFFDEAGMADTRRMDALTDLVASSGAKLVVVGDERQLPSIGAGGMFERLAEHAPTARLSEVRRTEDPDERRAWADLRAGRAERAMAHYHARGHLHLSDSRDQAVERAVWQWADLTDGPGGLGAREVALMSDASTGEIDRLNARAQHLRRDRGELGRQEVALPEVAYGVRAGDRVAFTAQHHPDGERRVENGTRGEVVAVNARRQQVTVRTDEAEREVTLADDELGALRLGYAQHLYRQQGATVDRAVVVTGGWQTSREGAYVEASRSRRGTDWHVAREDLGTDGADSDRIERLAERMRASRAQTPSLAFDEPEMDKAEPGLERELALSTERALEHSLADRLDRGLDRGIDQSLDIDDDVGWEL